MMLCASSVFERMVSFGVHNANSMQSKMLSHVTSSIILDDRDRRFMSRELVVVKCLGRRIVSVMVQVYHQVLGEIQLLLCNA